MSAVINRGGGRPSKGLRDYIGFRTPAKTAEDVKMIATAEVVMVNLTSPPDTSNPEYRQTLVDNEFWDSQQLFSSLNDLLHRIDSKP